ncbi:MAG: NAD-dependent epimerase/dehydratase family protein [Candidatus Peribacteraceae bacterium]|nr:NAD-dependent epimerase/dehydratase family protein [Candidatus Peribacteraceae bacterium]
MDRVNLKNKKILVTGGNGYLGRILIKSLLPFSSKIFSVDLNHNSCQNKVVCYDADLLDKKKLTELIHDIQPSVIYHLAANLNRTRDFSMAKDIFAVNLTGTLNLLNSLKEVQYDNLIFTSTSEVYGGANIKVPFSENDNFVPASPYSLSKYCAEMSIKTFSEINNRNYTILRLFNFYGKDMSKKFFLPQLIEKLKKNEDFDMTNGEQKRDYLHIDDIINALLLSSTAKAYNDVFNVCSGAGISLRELAVNLKDNLNSTSKINFGAIPYRENEVWEMIGNNEKISNLGFNQKLAFLENIDNE